MLSPRRQSRRTARLSAIRTTIVPGNALRPQEETAPTSAPATSTAADVISYHSSLSSDEAVYDRLERLKVFDSTEGSPYTRRKQEVPGQQQRQHTANDDIEIVENFYSDSNDSSNSIELVDDSSVEDFAVVLTHSSVVLSRDNPQHK